MRRIIEQVLVTLAVLLITSFVVYATNSLNGWFQNWITTGKLAEMTRAQPNLKEDVDISLIEGKLNTLTTRIDQINSPFLSGEQFCVLRSGGRCPQNFNIGTICVDSEDSKNKDFIKGIVGDSGDGNCGGSSKQFELCCR